jgi:hypothetical protein
VQRCYWTVSNLKHLAARHAHGGAVKPSLFKAIA